MQKFLFVQTHELQNPSETLDEIFTIVRSLRLLDVNVLINKKNTMIWSLYYHVMYDKDCYSGTVFELERFTPENYTLPNAVFIKIFISSNITQNH